MSKRIIPASIVKARRAYQRAAEALSAATKRAYPVGAVVTVRLGRSTVTGVVLSAGSAYWWHEPDRVWIENIKTGKSRKFTASGYATEVIYSGDTEQALQPDPVEHP